MAGEQALEMPEAQENFRRGFDMELVWRACDELDAKGEKPTYERVRMQLGGRGSFSYIAEGLKTWVPARGKPLPPLPEAMADRLQHLAATVWNEAMTMAKTEFRADRISLESRINELMAAVGDYETDLRSSTEQLDTLNAAAERDRALIRELENQLHESRGRISALEQLAARPAARTGSRKPRPTLVAVEDTASAEEFGK